MTEPLIFELSAPGRTAFTLPDLDVPASPLPAGLTRVELDLPEVSELDLVRHYTRLSQLNFAIDTEFYPLGSCTMKYNPKVNERAASLPGFALAHPQQRAIEVQGNLELMYLLQDAMERISGFARVSLQPAAGAHGELAGVLMIKAYHRKREDTDRLRMLIPDSAHGTNPASCAMAGFEVAEIPSDSRGNTDIKKLKSMCGQDVAGLMLTNPNTLGLFEEHVLEISETIHECGGLVYGDGANLNALLGIVRPGDLGIDVMHFNLHKTFSTPHGGGGPGSGPVGASSVLADFLPGPIAVKDGDAFALAQPQDSVGRMKAFQGNFAIFVRALTYIRMLGPDGLRAVAEHAVLNANYLQSQLKDVYSIPFGKRRCMHEFVAHGDIEGTDVRALDVAKRLIDYGFHPPTNYFPLIVHDALMIEPTETESKETLDAFVEAMKSIKVEAQETPQLLHDAPLQAPLRRLDEVSAARHPVLSYES
jgi:glycine dehydrogenase subunit 2